MKSKIKIPEEKIECHTCKKKLKKSGDWYRNADEENKYFCSLKHLYEYENAKKRI